MGINKYLQNIGWFVGLSAIWAFASPLVGWREVALGVDPAEMGMLKTVENGYAIFWQRIQGKTDSDRIHIYNLATLGYLTISPLDQLPEADEANVWDCSVGRNGLIAIAVNAVSSTNSRETVVNLIMMYDVSGRLLAVHRSSREDGQEFTYLKVDDDNSIWALSRSNRRANPATTPLLHRFLELGRKVETLYTRALVPGNEVTRHVVKGVGSVTFGINKESLYCWFPQTQEMVVMAKDGSGVRRFSATVPKAENVDPRMESRVMTALLGDDNKLFFDVIYEPRCNADPKECPSPWRATYWRDKAGTQWKVYGTGTEGLPPLALVGTSGGEPIFMSMWKTPEEHDSFKIFLPSN